jgi:3-deoxy-D-manno-octulosonic acid kinase
MKRQWPLGSEVKRKELTGGAMLYDASRAGNLAPAWFDPNYWKDRNEIEGEARGRGTVYFVRHGGMGLVLRHYRRGGLIGRFSRDRYMWRGEQQTRSFSEWQLTYHLHRAGLPVPAPVAARFKHDGLSYSADLITERIATTESLAERLRARSLSILAWIAIGRCIRSFHDLGVCHADLNAHNVLLAADGAVYLIDFDRSRLMKPGLWCDSNLVRLRRSLEKVTYGLPPDRISEADWHGLLDGYRQSVGKPASPAPPRPPPPANEAPDFALAPPPGQS